MSKSNPKQDPDFHIHHAADVRPEHFEIIIAEPKSVTSERKADRPRQSRHAKDVKEASFIVGGLRRKKR